MLSYARGPDAPVFDKTIAQALNEAVAAHKEREALVVAHQKVRLTYRELHHLVQRTARGLCGIGLKPGDRAGIWASNCLEWVLLQFGCAMAGVVLVNVNPAYRSVDLRYVLRKSRMRALFLYERDARADYRGILEEACAGQDLALDHMIFLGQGSWDRMLDNGQAFTGEPLPEDVANIQYTSGTTGSPKGVLLTHRNLVNNAWSIGEWMNVGPGSRVCVPLPLYHCAGCVAGSLCSLIRGATLILPSAQFDAGAVLRAIHAERGTLVGGVPTMMVAMLEHPDFASFDLSSLEYLWVGGAPCPVELMRRLRSGPGCGVPRLSTARRRLRR
jgi:fatty-acyl-CoA synthase